MRLIFLVSLGTPPELVVRNSRWSYLFQIFEPCGASILRNAFASFAVLCVFALRTSLTLSGHSPTSRYRP